MKVGSFCGRAGQDAEVNFLPSGVAVCKFSLAVNRPKKHGEDQKPLWVNCVIFGERAEKLGQYITKGGVYAVSGEIDLREWESQKTGKSGVSLECNVSTFSFAGSKQDVSAVAPAPVPTSQNQGPVDDSDIPF
jgi:single-strand DNA-binding protein